LIRPTVFGNDKVEYEKQSDPFVKESAVKCIVYVICAIYSYSRIKRKYV
jgi:hypothetical protein